MHADKLATPLALALSVASLLAPAGLTQAQEILPAGYVIDDLLVGACRLPPKLIRLGTRSTRLGPRRVVMTTGVECGIRQGEYIAYDPGNLATARRHWHKQAEQGEAEAQNYLGEIYERGLGTDTDERQAFEWYYKAAAQGLRAAQFNLAKAYELGRGVDVDLAAATVWYRRASGLPDLTAAETLKDQQQKELLVATPAVAPPGAPRIEMLEPRLADVRGLKVVASAPGIDAQTIVGRITSTNRLRSVRVNDNDVQVSSSGLFETLVTVDPEAGSYIRVVATDERNLTAEVAFLLRSTPASGFGRYQALLIGIENYDSLKKLETPLNDIDAIGEILRERYGFVVRPPLADASRADILIELNRLKRELSADDNLLIYYAGHGELDEVNDRGHWLPRDAQIDDTTNWISNTSVTDLLKVMAARGVLVVSDSCYAGTLVNLRSNEQVTFDIEVLRRQRSRTVLASGGREPVLDSGSNGHSVFANAFIEALNANQGVFDAAQLLQQIRPRVAAAARALDIQQVPLHAPINTAGHENGAFFFVARTSLGNNLLTSASNTPAMAATSAPRIRVFKSGEPIVSR